MNSTIRNIISNAEKSRETGCQRKEGKDLYVSNNKKRKRMDDHQEEAISGAPKKFNRKQQDVSNMVIRTRGQKRKQMEQAAQNDCSVLPKRRKLRETTQNKDKRDISIKIVPKRRQVQSIKEADSPVVKRKKVPPISGEADVLENNSNEQVYRKPLKIYKREQEEGVSKMLFRSRQKRKEIVQATQNYSPVLPKHWKLQETTQNKDKKDTDIKIVPKRRQVQSDNQTTNCEKCEKSKQVLLNRIAELEVENEFFKKEILRLETKIEEMKEKVTKEQARLRPQMEKDLIPQPSPPPPMEKTLPLVKTGVIPPPPPPLPPPPPRVPPQPPFKLKVKGFDVINNKVAEAIKPNENKAPSDMVKPSSVVRPIVVPPTRRKKGGIPAVGGPNTETEVSIQYLEELETQLTLRIQNRRDSERMKCFEKFERKFGTWKSPE